jgi:hypothetical protein
VCPALEIGSCLEVDGFLFSNVLRCTQMNEEAAEDKEHHHGLVPKAQGRRGEREGVGPPGVRLYGPCSMPCPQEPSSMSSQNIDGQATAKDIQTAQIYRRSGIQNHCGRNWLTRDLVIRMNSSPL